MVNPTTYSSHKQFIGIGKETTQGTAVTPTVTMPVEKFEPEDQVTPLDDNSLRGSMVETYDRIQGVGKGEFGLSGPYFADTFGFLLGNLLGDIATTGASAPYTHAFSTLNTGASQPGSFTITDYQGTPATYSARAYPGCCLSELIIKGNAESSLITCDAKGMSWPSAIASATPTSSPSTEQAVAAWRFQLALAGTLPASAVLTVGEFEFSLKRELQPIYTGQNSRNPYFIQRGKVSASGKLKFVAAADETPLLYLLNNTQPQFQLLITNGVTPSSAAGYRALQVDSYKAAWKNAKIERGASAVGYEVEFDSIATTTNAGASGGYSPAKLTLVNAVASGTY